jgi:ATP-dependent RNA helicase RhlE
MKFQSLHIADTILRALKDEGYTTPTPIQAQTIPLALEGKDILASAQTGTGKTAAFAIPILQLLSAAKTTGNKRKIRALILVPTRELAVQVSDSIKAYGRHTHLDSTVIFGGVRQGAQTRSLQKGVDILVATPGRLHDLIDQGYVSLKDVEIFVLDEADRMLDMGFINDVKKVVRALPQDRQTLFFSATMPPDIARLAHDILHKPEKIAVSPPSSTVETIEQYVYFVDRSNKSALLLHLLETKKMPSVLVFTRTKRGADVVVRTLEKNRIKADAIHGNKAQNARQRALMDFKNGRIRVLVATDIASRGIDIDDLEYVINYEIPEVPETYVHRIGRGGRAGGKGTSYSLCDASERIDLRAIEKLIGKKIPVVEDHPFPPGTQKPPRPGQLHSNHPPQKPQEQKAAHKTEEPKRGLQRFPPRKSKKRRR